MWEEGALIYGTPRVPNNFPKNNDLDLGNAKSSFDNVIQKARATSFLDGWVSSLNIPNIPLDSSHRVLKNVSLPEDIFPKEQAPKGQVGTDQNSLSFDKLFTEVDAHMTVGENLVVVEDNPQPLPASQPLAPTIHSTTIEANPVIISLVVKERPNV